MSDSFEGQFVRVQRNGCFRNGFQLIRRVQCAEQNHQIFKDIDLRLKKNKKIFGPNFQNYLKIFVSPSKKCQPYNFHIWELYDKHFFQKTKTSVFYHQIVLLESNSHRNEFIPVFNHF